MHQHTSFSTVQEAADCIVATLQHGVDVARAEMLDATTMRCVKQNSESQGQTFRGNLTPTVFFEFQGNHEAVKEQVIALLCCGLLCCVVLCYSFMHVWLVVVQLEN